MDGQRTARAAPNPNPLPAANPQPPAGRGDSRVVPLTRSVQLTLPESPLPAGGVGVGGGERVRVRGGSRDESSRHRPSFSRHLTVTRRVKSPRMDTKLVAERKKRLRAYLAS